MRLQGISKRGDAYVRTLLIHGARSVHLHAKEPGPWLEQIKTRRPGNVVIVAQAAKMARAIWAKPCLIPHAHQPAPPGPSCCCGRCPRAACRFEP